MFSITGCSPHTEKAELPIDTTGTFSYSGPQEAADRWWQSFNDPALNNLVDSAMSRNFNVEIAWYRLEAARAALEREESGFFPDLYATLTGEIANPEYDFESSESVTFGLAAEYEVDLWGRINSLVDAQRYRMKSAMLDYQSAAVSVSAEIVRTWYLIAETKEQLKLIDEQIETNDKVLRLLKARFGSGQIRSVDILRQQQLLDATREQRIVLESRHRILENQLSVLLGKRPGKVTELMPEGLPDLPAFPKTGLHSELIKRRPDVKAAYMLLQAADRELAAAVSNQYPRLSLSAAASTTGDNTESIFEDWAYSLAGNLLAPIFYGGELSAEVDRTEAVKQQRIYEYSQTILTAFREVEDAIIQERSQTEIVQNIRQRIGIANQAYEQLRVEYFNGMAEYLDVLTALDQFQQLSRDYISAKMLLIDYRIALHRALAGGFTTGRETGDDE